MSASDECYEERSGKGRKKKGGGEGSWGEREGKRWEVWEGEEGRGKGGDERGRGERDGEMRERELGGRKGLEGRERKRVGSSQYSGMVMEDRLLN